MAAIGWQLSWVEEAHVAESDSKEAGNNLSRRELFRKSGQLGLAVWASNLPMYAAPLSSERATAVDGGYEHAAGPVMLPFSYQASHSPAAKPAGLNFSDQLNPDNCQVFVRIGEELWEFRSQWVINLGTTARYKGPDIDHMTRVEDGTYPDGMTACWFLGGMWYDQSESRLYAPMHIEHDGPRRKLPFSRKIVLATSGDKGLTWKYEGDIITSETYYYPHDFSKFSGSSYGDGVADFGFYADQLGGYFLYLPRRRVGAHSHPWHPLEQPRGSMCHPRQNGARQVELFLQRRMERNRAGRKIVHRGPQSPVGRHLQYSPEKVRRCMLLGNQDPPEGSNIDGIYIGCCSDLGKQDWTWGHCAEAMFGFFNLVSSDGSGHSQLPALIVSASILTSAAPIFRRLDIKLSVRSDSCKRSAVRGTYSNLIRNPPIS